MTLRPGSALIIAFTLIHSGGSEAGSPQALTTKSIEAAIILGQAGMPRPYLLRHTPGGIKPNPVILGNLYTPFIRVALASYKQTLEGRLLAPADVDSTGIEPLLYVAIRNDKAARTITGPRVFLTPRPIFPSREKVPPIWIRQASSVLRSFEDEKEIGSLALVAAFPLRDVKPGLVLVIERDGPTEGSVIFAESHITKEELETWR